MAIGPRLDLRQSQQLVMTPQLQQAIKLLALSNLEIEAFVAEEVEKNPLLENTPDERESADAEREAAPDFISESFGDGESAFEGTADDWSQGVPGDEPVTADRLMEIGDGAGEAPLDVDYAAETFHHDGPSDGGYGLDGGLGMDNGAAAGMSRDDGSGFEAMLSPDISLHDHLLTQAGARFSGTDLIIAAHLIDLIDESGYLVGALLDVADRLGTPLYRIEAVLAGIQSFEPTGVGARNLSECLALQAIEADRHDPAMARLIERLDLLARGDLAALRRICGVDQEDLADMIRELRNYNPKPGLEFGGERTQTVVPDIYVAKTRGGWAVELNGATLPRLLINRSYYAEVSSNAGDKACKQFMADCMASANWLMKALDQRARTIVKVATEIVKQQEGFFQQGVSQLKPMTLRAVAEAIGMHESTVSRVTSNKFMSCDRGLFELKYFFTSAIQSADGGDAASAEAVKDAIAKLIAAERPDDIVSDDKLVELLRAQGFDIARRTVAKYREALGIGSSVQRRRQKLITASHAA